VAEIVTVPVLHKGKCHHEVILVGCWLLQACCKLFFNLCRI
jgi:hypothetical protein